MVSAPPRLSAGELAALAQLSRPEFVAVAGPSGARVQRKGTDRRRRPRGRLSLATVRALEAAGWLAAEVGVWRLTAAGVEGVAQACGARAAAPVAQPKRRARRLAAGVAGWASAAAHGQGPLTVAQAALALRLRAAVEAVEAAHGPRSLDWTRVERVDASPRAAAQAPHATAARALLAVVDAVLDGGERAVVWALCVAEEPPRAVEARLGLVRGGALRRLAGLLQRVLEASSPSSRR